MENPRLQVKRRTETGKGSCRRMRKEGLIPAILYGKSIDPVNLALAPKDLQQVLSNPRGLNTVLELAVSGDGGEKTYTAMLRDYQLDYLHCDLIHADFVQLSMDDTLRLSIPVQLTGKAQGVKEGGIMQQVRRSLTVECRPADIPEYIPIDVSELDIGQSVHIEDMDPPPGATFKYQANITIVTVVPPTAIVEAPPAEVVEEVPVEEAAPGEKPAEEAPAPVEKKSAPAKEG